MATASARSGLRGAPSCRRTRELAPSAAIRTRPASSRSRATPSLRSSTRRTWWRWRVAPAACAARTSRSSNTVRGTVKVPGGRAARTVVPSPVASSNQRAGAYPATADVAPRPSRIATAWALMASPHALSRGNAARSTSRTEASGRAARAASAAAAPAGPAPAITTSCTPQLCVRRNRPTAYFVEPRLREPLRPAEPPTARTPAWRPDDRRPRSWTLRGRQPGTISC